MIEKLEGTWLAAVSAGPDSMALLSMCIEAGVSCAAAHVNYHHRPQADEEEEYVRLFCSQHGIVLHVLNTPFAYTGNFEAAARSHRYDFFAETVKKYGYRGVLVAHQEDDLLETYFMQEEKNLVPEYYGLKEEMMYRGILVKRPLLDKTKAQLTEYCQSHGIRYYIDATNQDVSLARNRIRQEITEPLSRTQRDLVRREINMKNAQAQERSCRVRTYIRASKVQLEEYRKLNANDRQALLRMIMDEQKHHSLAFIRQIDQILTDSDDFEIEIGNRRLVQKDGQFFMTDCAQPYSFEFESLQDVLSFSQAAPFRIEPGSPGVNAVTVHEEDFPLTIRCVQEGDAIAMRFGTKKVHRFFIDRHIPLYLRKTWPAVVNREGNIILIPGLGCDRFHFSISPDFNVLQ